MQVKKKRLHGGHRFWSKTGLSACISGRKLVLGVDNQYWKAGSSEQNPNSGERPLNFRNGSSCSPYGQLPSEAIQPALSQMAQP